MSNRTQQQVPSPTLVQEYITQLESDLRDSKLTEVLLKAQLIVANKRIKELTEGTLVEGEDEGTILSTN